MESSSASKTKPGALSLASSRAAGLEATPRFDLSQRAGSRAVVGLLSSAVRCQCVRGVRSGGAASRSVWSSVGTRLAPQIDHGDVP